MDQDESIRKSYEAFLNRFYPPVPLSRQREVEQEAVLPHGLDLDALIPADRGDDDNSEEGNSSTSSGASESGTQKKLTRAQRKRLRKKKLKEAASRRRKIKIIGPLLPSTTSDSVDVPEAEPPRPGEDDSISKANNDNISEGFDSEVHNQADEPCTSRNKLKHRRLAKRLSRNAAKCNNTENHHQADSQPCSDYDNSALQP
ncbi:PREDICTED: uncharacterized protein LOC104608772 isoform X2 [Nelumbo nucifera]|uniref:Uncharacterized protein LOC104608772 isoform X2 n=1 Tax=Nelumbo nucifera TaxID=4432 RepID=A0A1U8AYD1_NELNU|nr:PREDICTED: uncharacterized protein LOC104608772 isoform X2 [Nelumbo nucifera]